MEFRDKYITGVSRVLKEFKPLMQEIKPLSKEMISLKEKQTQISQKFQECFTENKEEMKTLKTQVELLDKRIRDIQVGLANMEMARTLEFLSQRQTLPKTSNLSHYILFEYCDHIRSGFRNLGDYVQTFAVKKALDKIEQNFTYEFFDRDNFSFYNGGGGIAIMQAYFARKKSFIPNSSVLSVFIGAHFTGGTQNFLKQFLAINPDHFKDKEIGCRDDFTLDFCKNLGLKSYLSRCLTLTLPKRKSTNLQNKVFLVNVPDSYLQYLPKDLIQNAERINQKGVRSALANEKEFYEQTKVLLKRYENEAKLVIATALHCASPCTAMGIPVVLLADNYNEQKTRFGALKGIVKIHTLQDLQEQNIDFNIKAPDIEELKNNMLENLKLSIAKAKGEKADEQRLEKIRNEIENFNVLEN